MELTPAILERKQKKIAELLRKIQGVVPRVQIDILDGRFADNKTVSLSSLQKIKVLKDFKVDLHLMVQSPLQLIEAAEKINTNAYVAHVEAVKNQVGYVKNVVNAGLNPGLALALNTPVKTLDKKVFSHLKQVLLMSIVLGFQGQPFKPKIYKKIAELEQIKKQGGFEFEICIDGGINYKRARKCFKVGADVVSVGSYFWKQKDYKEVYTKFKKIG